MAAISTQSDSITSSSAIQVKSQSLSGFVNSTDDGTCLFLFRLDKGIVFENLQRQKQISWCSYLSHRMMHREYIQTWPGPYLLDGQNYIVEPVMPQLSLAAHYSLSGLPFLQHTDDWNSNITLFALLSHCVPFLSLRNGAPNDSCPEHN